MSAVSDRVPFTEAIAPIRARYRQLTDEAVQWCAQRGHPISPDLFTLVLAGSPDRASEPDDPPSARLTRSPGLSRVAVHTLLSDGIADWCALANVVSWPVAELAPAMWQWLDFLHGTGRLAEGSDPLWELRKPLICHGGLDFEGRPRAHGDPSPIPCECHLPYREVAEYLLGRVRDGTLDPEALRPGERPGSPDHHSRNETGKDVLGEDDNSFPGRRADPGGGMHGGGEAIGSARRRGDLGEDDPRRGCPAPTLRPGPRSRRGGTARDGRARRAHTRRPAR